MAYEVRQNYTPIYEYVPYELRANIRGELLSNWVAFELVQESGRVAKIPINPKTGYKAKANDPSTWGTLSEARDMADALWERNKNNLGVGIGFELGNSPFIVLDIDHCINEQGELNEIATEILSIQPETYTEISPSGTGLHLIYQCELPLSEFSATFKNTTGRKNEKLGLEIYDTGRYITFTSKYYNYRAQLARDNEKTRQALQRIIEKYFQESESKAESKVEAIPSSVKAPVTESDSELWDKMFNSQSGAKIRKLFNGDTSEYNNDDSSADQALCCFLAYWTNLDESRIDSMFRQSGLMREKWERADYRESTIKKALARTNEYIPKAPEQAPQAEPQAKPLIMDAQYLAESFESDILNFQKYSDRKTGFSNLDAKITLYPGLYVVGAISSLGKTTFCLQMSDQLAESGEHVLYFAFEQTRFELVSKSLARITQPADSFIESLPTAIEIRRGRTYPELRDAMQKYSEIGKRKAVIECDFQTDINAVIETVESYIMNNTVKPVVFVDYLQLIRSANPKLTNTKDIVDENIRALKLLQMRRGLVMFVVSSLNRQNYLTTIDFESFKESGSIEFTADVIMGLQLAIMNSSVFTGSEGKINEKRNAVKAAKRENPRRIELCILKNRYGVANLSLYFNYYAKYDSFEPATYEDMLSANEDLLDSLNGNADIDG